MVARGEYMKRNGYRDHAEVMLEHVDRVMELCREMGYSPMIWSDMLFGISNNGVYYSREAQIPQPLIDRMEKGPQLVYWEYYGMDRERFDHMLECHKRFHNPIAFAGSAPPCSSHTRKAEKLITAQWAS